MGRLLLVALGLLSLGWLLSVAAPACSPSPAEPVGTSSPDGAPGGPDAGPDACPVTGPECYPTPLPPDASSLMILNACTDAQAFDPAPSLPLLGPCAKLPPLP
jgi:hypothetical protein